MRKILVATFAAFLFVALVSAKPAEAWLAQAPSSGGGGTFALVAHGAAGALSSNNNGVTTAGINTTGANLIVVGVAAYGGGTFPGTLTDSLSNTWTILTPQNSGGSNYAVLYYCYAPTVGSGQTFTYTSSFSFPSIGVAAFSGAIASPFDQQNGAVAASGLTIQPGSVTPSVNNEVVLTVFSDGASGVSFSIDSGFTITDQLQKLNNGTNNQEGLGLAYIIQTTAGATNPTWTAGGSSTMAATIATFKP